MPKLDHLLAHLRRRVSDTLASSGGVARVAVNLRPVYSSWGGGNQWLTQTVRFLRFSGYTVRFDLNEPVDCLLLTHFGLTGKTSFNLDEIRAYLQKHPETKVVHRVNDNDARKHTTEMNPRLAAYTDISDHTVFISSWLRDHHAEHWFDKAKPHSVIVNGADPAVFHPIGSRIWNGTEPLRLVTHHWSDNWMKGFKVYEEVDRLIASGELPGVELWVIGRWPAEIQWKAARTFPAAHGEALAELLRQCHAYLTASLWEPGGMHFIEGGQCGLPVLFHEDGGGICEVARPFGIGFRDDVKSAIEQLRARYHELRRLALEQGPAGDSMSLAYRKIVQQVLAERHGT